MLCVQEKRVQPQRTLEQSQLAIKNNKLQQYISERVFKDKSDLCRIAIPYILEDQSEKPKQKTMKQNMEMSKAQKKRTKYQVPMRSHKAFKPSFSYEKAPINEYLNYELSEQINQHLKEVKHLADEIKQIKEQKNKQIKQVQQKKVNNKNIRIRRTNFKNKLKISLSAEHIR